MVTIHHTIDCMFELFWFCCCWLLGVMFRLHIHVHMTNTCCASSATYMYKWWTFSVINTYKCSTCSITGLADETLSDQGQQISCQYLTRHPAPHPQQVALKSNWPESFLCHLKYLDVKLSLDCSRAVPTNQKKVRVRRAMLRTGWRPDFGRWVPLLVIAKRFAIKLVFPFCWYHV